jgi:hypothetical protein
LPYTHQKMLGLIKMWHFSGYTLSSGRHLKHRGGYDSAILILDNPADMSMITSHKLAINNYTCFNSLLQYTNHENGPQYISRCE